MSQLLFELVLLPAIKSMHKRTSAVALGTVQHTKSHQMHAAKGYTDLLVSSLALPIESRSPPAEDRRSTYY